MAVLTLHTASLSSLSSPRITILTASSRSGLCSALTSSHGPRNHMWGASRREEVSDYGSHQEWPTFCVRNTFLEDLHAGHGRCPVLGAPMGRREFIAIFGGAVAALPLAALAQRGSPLVCCFGPNSRRDNELAWKRSAGATSLPRRLPGIGLVRR